MIQVSQYLLYCVTGPLVFTSSHLFCMRVHVLFMFFVFIYAYWCPTQLPYHMIFVLFNSNTMDDTSGAGTAHSSGAPQLAVHATFLVSFVYVAQYLVSQFLSSCPFSFGHYSFCPSIYDLVLSIVFLDKN